MGMGRGGTEEALSSFPTPEVRLNVELALNLVYFPPS